MTTESLQCAHAKPDTYDFKCARCCARLVASARPSRKLQEHMLAAIAQFKEAASREEILNILRLE